MKNELRQFNEGRFSSEVVSPHRIQIISEDIKKNRDVDEIMNALAESTKNRFKSRNGKGTEKQYMIDKFRKNLLNLLGQYEFIQLVKISEDCIKNDGSIDINKFEAFLESGRGEINESEI